MNWAILVIYADGSQEYVKQGEAVARFPKAEAKHQLEFMRIGMEGDPDIQSMNIVKAPVHKAKKIA